MTLFVFMIILAALGVGALIYRSKIEVPELNDTTRNPVTGRMGDNKQDIKDAKIGRWITLGVGLALILVPLMVIGFSSFTIVPARNLGIPIALGQPGDVMDNGAHPKAPWVDVETFDATVKTLTVDQAVRLGNGGTATVDASIQWQIDPAKNNFLSLYRQYRTFDNIQANVIQRDFAAALNDVFE